MKPALTAAIRFIHSSLPRYGNLLWGRLSATKIHNFQKLRDRAITLIQSAPIKDRIPSAILSVKELIKLDQAVMVHKI